MEYIITASKIIGAGLATIGFAGSGVGIGNVFAGFLQAAARNPSLMNRLFPMTILGFALSESVCLFALMMAFLLLFGV